MSNINYEDLYFDISKFGGRVKIQDAYPELSAFKQVSKIKEEEWKVAILITDVGSPFVKIKDARQKLDEIFKEIDLDKRKKHKSIYDGFIDQRQCGVVHACSFLIEYHNNHQFAAWYELNKMYYQLIEAISSNKLDVKSDNYIKDLEDKMKLQDRLEKMQDSLTKYETALFGSKSMKAEAVAKSKKISIYNWNERFADENQVE